ncbi:MAG: hypothetical protein K8F91_24845, partial [Candidatus Obscuribacterales bacterium]|nr:hypothetical protein [Candidatus Obscuribacterales bacterium]
FAATLSKENFTRTVVMTRHGEPRVYWCFGKNMMLKHWRKFRIVISYDNKKLEEELGFEVAYPEGMPVPMLEPIGQKCRFFEMELLQSFVHYIKALVLEKRDTQEVLTALAFKRLNRLAH